MKKSQVNKLGIAIRRKQRENILLSEADYVNLQAYRTSFKEDLAPVFQFISTFSRKKKYNSLVSFRIKRIESILSKIKREPTMSLGNMGDIAGCRMILNSENALKDIAKAIDEKYNVKEIKDYTLIPKEDGYTGYHMYIKSPINEDKLLEIQLRTFNSHIWASLVEIIDLIFNLKLKEGQKHESLQKFLKILSLKKDTITIEQKKEIIDIDSKFGIYKLLNEVFLKNNISFRKSWLELNNKPDNFFFIIDVDENNKSNMFSIKDYKEAEEKYFEMFLSDKKSNFVLTYIEKPTFHNICTAYSSYILIKHNYLEDWSFFAKGILKNGYDDNSKSIEIYAQLIARNLKDQQEILLNEIEEINKQINLNGKENYHKINEWLTELREKIESINVFYEEATKIKVQQKKSIFKKIIER